MSGGITVKEFRHVAGLNDAEYIKLLEIRLENQKRITSAAIDKIKAQAREIEVLKDILCVKGRTSDEI